MLYTLKKPLKIQILLAKLLSSSIFIFLVNKKTPNLINFVPIALIAMATSQ